MSQRWGDLSRVFADQVMSGVQLIQGSTDDGRRRDAAPFYTFGALLEQSQVPPTQLPAVQWRQADGRWTDIREVTGYGPATGSIGTTQQSYEVKVFGTTRDQCFDEHLYIVQSVTTLFQPNPPIRDFAYTWLEPGQAQQNRKETMLLTFSAPLKVPFPPVVLAPVLAVTASMVVASVSGSLSGSQPAPVRTIVVH